MNSEIFSGIAGLFLNYIVEFIKTKLPETKGRWLGYVLGYGACLIVGALASLLEGKLNSENVLSSAGAALIVSQGYYNLYFKPSGMDKTIERIHRY